MKKAWLIVGIMAAVLTFTGAAMAAAPPPPDPTIILNALNPRYDNGGPFIATVGGNYGDLVVDAAGKFTSFCLEKGETVMLGHDHYHFTIDTFADGGSGGAVGGKDDLDPMSAYLYYTYRNVTAKLPDLQAALWFIEQEVTSIPGTAMALVTEASTSGWTDIKNVRVLNLYLDNNNNGAFDEGDGKRQSQIALIEPSHGVPEPATMLLLGLGLVGLAGIGRRFKG